MTVTFFVTEASRLGFWSIGQVFSRYRTYEGEKERPLTEQEMKHLNTLMDEATVVVDKFVESDPEQVQWLAQIRERFAGTQVSVVATPWDQSLANRVALDLGAVASSTLDAKLAMAEVVLRSADRANRRRQGLLEEETESSGDAEWDPAEPPLWLSELPPTASPDIPAAEPDPAEAETYPGEAETYPGEAETYPGEAETYPPDVQIISMLTESDSTENNSDNPDNPDWWPFTPGVRTVPALTESDSTEIEPGMPGS